MVEDDSLVVLWTSGDKEVAENMLFMYTLNAQKQGWWDDVRIIVWGPSSDLLSRDEDLQETVKEMMDEGVKVEACRACADEYGVAENLEDMGIDVKYMGEPLTDYLKEGRKVLAL